MKEVLAQYKEKGAAFWNAQSRLVKVTAMAILIAFVLAIILIVIQSRPNFVPLYSNLSASETGQIKQTLDSEGVPSKVSDNGTTISVPKNKVDDLKVELAAQGIPKSGKIDYGFFGKNAKWGMTDKEFGVAKQAAMQNELSRLISSINGVNSANVMISLPQQGVWVSQQDKKASASVVLNLAPGYQLKQEQVRSLYHLVSKSVPNLPVDNIVIMDQMFNYYELPNGGEPGSSTLAAYEQQRQVKENIEQDLRQRIQRMLGMMIGQNKVVVSVTTDIDFTKEKDTKKLVKPVDKQKMEGLPVSIEKVREAYSGNSQKAGGVAGTGSGDVPGYVTNSGNGNGNYTHVEQRINNVFNKIHKTIVKSPYTIRDIGIQVMVEPPNPKNPSSMPSGTVSDIKNILSTMIRTTLPKSVGQSLTKQQISKKIYVSVQPFNGKVKVQPQSKAAIPAWYYFAGGALLLIIILLLFLLLRNRNRSQEDDMIEDVRPPVETELDFPGEEDKEEAVRRKQLEKMAQEKPEEFAKLLRSWLSEE